MCEQDGRAGFYEGEIGLELWAEDVTVETAVDLAWRHYTHKNESRHHWPREDYDDVVRWTTDVVTHAGGIFSPLNRKIIAPELYFDLPIKESWAWYDERDPFTGDRLRGYLAIKGTMDLLTEVDAETLENLDWKSGRLWDWAKDCPKDFASLKNDSQLLLYYYALSRLFPHRYVLITIFYAQNKAPFTLDFDRKVDVPRALNMLRTKFEAIRNDQRPERIMDDPAKRWKCGSFCWYGRTNMQGNRARKDCADSICSTVHGEVLSLGLEKVMVKRGRLNAFKNYGSGGGVSNRET